ncbi:MAG: peroxiredoxin [Rhizobiaceae bacterium]
MAPEFKLPDQDGNDMTLSSLRGKYVVLYFYPKDDTSGCTVEAKDFSSLVDEFAKANAVVIGMSPDGAKSHTKFKTKHDLKVTLVSDEEKSALTAYGVWAEKSMYGKKYMGVERSTFLIAPDGIIKAAWRKVSVPSHAQSVLDALKSA